MHRRGPGLWRPRGPRLWRPRGDTGNSTVEFTLVSVLVLFLFLGIMQLGFVLHTRNVLVAAAQDGARFGANADRGPQDAEARTLEVVREAIGPGVADRMDRPRAGVVSRDGVQVMEVVLSGPLPLVFLPAGPLRITVRGHALEEG